MQQAVVSRNPEIMGGAPVFAGTRVPVQTLLDYLEGGESIDAFLEGFPSVTRAQVISFLEQARDRLVESVS
jgi:uncharacterized protein (DUF433 family)